MLILHIVVRGLRVLLVDHGYYVADSMSEGGWMSQDQAEFARQSLERNGLAMVMIGESITLFFFVPKCI